MKRPLLLQSVLRLRWVVAYLGEKDQRGWWDTSFLNENGRYYLAINYPRTAKSAALHSATVAARRLHDERIGRGRVHHLFRMPLEWEEDLQAEVRKADDWLPSVDSEADALAVLGDLAAPRTNGEEYAAVGPVQLRDSAALDEPLVQAMAAYYLSAFESKNQTFPYLLLA